VLCGCIPYSLTYWEPYASGGKSLNSSAAIGYKDMLEFSFNDVKVHFMGDETCLSVDIFIPKEKSASFITEEMELHDNNSSPKIIKFRMTYWDKKTLTQVYISPLRNMHGKNTYYGKVWFGGVAQSNYVIKAPLLKVDDQIFEIPIIEFTKKEGFGVGPIND
jgi:hypothetical protein